MNGDCNAAAVLDLVRRWTMAEEHNDAGILADLLTDDFVGVGPFGFVLTRGQWLGRYGGGLENRAFAVEDPQVHDHGDSAVTVGVLVQQTSFRGRDNSGRFRVTLAAIRRADRWLLASAHIGPLQDVADPSTRRPPGAGAST
jgi:ketosteroid isomerase-like protein